MYYNDHNPPHFHVIYNGIYTSIEIYTGNYMKGNEPLPKQKEKDVLEWLEINKDDIIKVWDDCMENRQPKKIPPLYIGGANMVLVHKAKIVPGLKGWLLINFDDRTAKLVNINPIMTGVLEKLKDQSFFEKVFVDDELRTVSWPGELDLDPDNLYQHGIDVDQVRNLVRAVKKNDTFSNFIDQDIV